MTAILNSDSPAEEDLHNLALAIEADPDSNFVVVAATVQGDHELRKAAGRLTATATPLTSTQPATSACSSRTGRVKIPNR
jgi:hypothetical protein